MSKYLFVFVIICLIASCSALFGSSPQNRWMSNGYYNNAPERFVSTHFGERFPHMQQDLLQRRDAGQGFIKRHIGAWTTPSNWQSYGDKLKNVNNNISARASGFMV